MAQEQPKMNEATKEEAGFVVSKSSSPNKPVDEKGKTSDHSFFPKKHESAKVGQSNMKDSEFDSF